MFAPFGVGVGVRFFDISDVVGASFALVELPSCTCSSRLESYIARILVDG